MSEMRDPRLLKAHPDNPRGAIDTNDPKFTNLRDDIARRGVIQPLVITSDDLILAGHRRQAAAIAAGLSEVPVSVRDLESHEFAEEIFLSENMNREDLTPLEEARTIDAVHKRLCKEWKREVTINDLSRRIDVPRETIRQRLNILKLPERVQRLYHIRELPLQSANQFVRLLEWPDEIEKFADRVVRRQLTNASLDAVITRRMKVLRADEPERPKVDRTSSVSQIVGNLGTGEPTLTRDVAVDRLTNAIPGSISMFSVKRVLDATCCACGMMGENSVCATCPLPRFVLGLVGRSDGGDA